MKVESVITLDNEKNILLLDKVNYENNNYFLGTVLNEFEEPTEDYAVLKESIENNEIYVEKVIDEFLLGELLKLFTKSFGIKVSELTEGDF